MAVNDNWIKKVEASCERFAKKHSIVYNKSERELSASFEIGCFHSILEFYEKTCDVCPKNLTEDGKYRYLTTPNGNPSNFSFVQLTHVDGKFALRQQVRIRSHIHPDIAFTPDLVVLCEDAVIDSEKDKDYAGGKRSFYTVRSDSVVAAHECKSMNPFPELLISFLGHLTAAHKWYEGEYLTLFSEEGTHLAPTLFVGGTARGLHHRMIRALEEKYPVNILVGMHSGNWRLRGAEGLKRLSMNILQQPVRKRRIVLQMKVAENAPLS